MVQEPVPELKCRSHYMPVITLQDRLRSAVNQHHLLGQVTQYLMELPTPYEAGTSQVCCTGVNETNDTALRALTMSHGHAWYASDHNIFQGSPISRRARTGAPEAMLCSIWKSPSRIPGF